MPRLILGYPPSGGGLSGSPPSVVPTGFFASPVGSPSGDGSLANPWDLQTAMNQPAGVVPGSPVWLRGGTYTGTFTNHANGALGNLITFKQFPNERATIDGRLLVLGSYVMMRGFEVMSSSPLSNSFAGVYHQSRGSKLVNLVIHDTSASGILTNPDSPDGEVYGCIVYNCGTHFNQDHGVYATNLAPSVKQLNDNIVFNNMKYGFQVNSPVAGELDNIRFTGNVGFGNGTISSPSVISASFILGSGIANAVGGRLINNMTYEVPASQNFAANIGIINTNHDIIVDGNYFVGFVEFSGWQTIVVNGNTFYWNGNVLSTTPPLGGWTWTNNVHYRDPTAAAWGTTDLHSFTTFAAWKAATGFGASDTNPGSAPTGTKVFVRPNSYEPGRANIIVYNWSHAATVDVDLSSVLAVNQAYYVVNAQNFYGAPVASGLYDGRPVTLPMAGIAAPVPISGAPAGPVTGPEFQAFVVRLQGS